MFAVNADLPECEKGTVNAALMRLILLPKYEPKEETRRHECECGCWTEIKVTKTSTSLSGGKCFRHQSKVIL